MRTFTRTLGSLSPAFLARSYLIGLVLLGAAVWMSFGSERGVEAHLPMLGLAIVQTLLFPFARLAWNELRDFLLGNTIFFGGVLIVVLSKIVVNVLLWAFALFAAPLGLGYLWFRSHSSKTGF